MLPDDVQLISVDDHVIEHPRVWEDRLPQKYKERGPRIVETDVRCVWLYDGVTHSEVGLNAVAGKSFEERGIDPMKYSDMRPGCYDVEQRIEDMDIDGVHAELCFPTLPGFAGRTFFEAKDKELALACVQVWNDFMLDEWCAHAPDRFIPLVLIPYWDVDLSVAEIERTAAKGARTITFPERPETFGLPSWYTSHWDPVFSAAQAAEMPLSMHFGSGGVPQTSVDSPLVATVTLFGQASMSACVDLLFSPVFHRFPALKVVLAEGGIGWMPYTVERADYEWERHRRHQPGINQDVPPSELFREHIFGCFISDGSGLRDRAAIGVENLMWEGDYPHSDCNWPGARKRLAEDLHDVPDDEARLIAEGNARRTFRFPRRG